LFEVEKAADECVMKNSVGFFNLWTFCLYGTCIGSRAVGETDLEELDGTTDALEFKTLHTPNVDAFRIFSVNLDIPGKKERTIICSSCCYFSIMKTN